MKTENDYNYDLASATCSSVWNRKVTKSSLSTFLTCNINALKNVFDYMHTYRTTKQCISNTLLNCFRIFCFVANIMKRERERGERKKNTN